MGGVRGLIVTASSPKQDRNLVSHYLCINQFIGEDGTNDSGVVFGYEEKLKNELEKNILGGYAAFLSWGLKPNISLPFKKLFLRIIAITVFLLSLTSLAIFL